MPSGSAVRPGSRATACRRHSRLSRRSRSPRCRGSWWRRAGRIRSRRRI
ncbi:hypothetical protein BC938DRAFT_472510, partial [Jimgerdemannia flammicorona]